MNSGHVVEMVEMASVNSEEQEALLSKVHPTALRAIGIRSCMRGGRWAAVAVGLLVFAFVGAAMFGKQHHVLESGDAASVTEFADASAKLHLRSMQDACSTTLDSSVQGKWGKPKKHKWKCNSPECVAVKGAAASYRFASSTSGTRYSELGKVAADDLRNAGFSFVRGWKISKGNDVDFSGLWEKKRSLYSTDCMITFQGSDDNADMVNNYDATPVSLWGLKGVHRGVATELKPLVAKMSFTDIKTRCTGSLTVVGHSLGGALAQVFSAMINHPRDPLNAGLHVDKLYAFGSMSPANHWLNDDCFHGELYWNAHIMNGTMFVDVLAEKSVNGANLTFLPVKADKTLLFAPGFKQTYQCGNKVNRSDFKDAGMFLHDLGHYELNLGCITKDYYDAINKKFSPGHR